MRKLLVGLGNPGEEYKQTRHNTGFIIIEQLAENQNVVWKKSRKFKGEYSIGEEYIFLKPHTFMNLSGEAVSRALSYFKITSQNLYVIHDDADITPFTYKLQFGKEAAGQHGVEDIINTLGTNQFWRVRIGTGRPRGNSFDIEDWVLTKFSYEELTEILKLAEDVEQKLINLKTS